MKETKGNRREKRKKKKIERTKEKDKKRIQTVKNHLEGTAKLSGEFAGKLWYDVKDKKRNAE